MPGVVQTSEIPPTSIQQANGFRAPPQTSYSNYYPTNAPSVQSSNYQTTATTTFSPPYRANAGAPQHQQQIASAGCPVPQQVYTNLDNYGGYQNSPSDSDFSMLNSNGAVLMNNPMISGNPPLASVTTVGPSGSQSGASSTTSSVGRLGADAGSFVPTMQPIGSVGPPGMINEDSLDGDLGPMPRDRCNTWPLRRPNLDINAQTSPLIHEQIPEEEHDFTLYDSNEHLGRLGASSAASTGLLHSPDGGNTFSPDMNSPTMGSGGNGSNGTLNELDGATTKKSTTRRNAWGNLSYADLITQAIMQSPEKRLTLSQGKEK